MDVFGREVDWAAVGTWLLSFGLIVYLGLEGGGFDPLVHDQVGIAVWWVVLATVLAGALPRRGLSRTALASLILLAAFAVWTALSLIWTESAEATFTEIARVTTYVGVFLLALSTRDPRETQRLISAVAAAIVLIATIALLSRLHPGWFGDSRQTGQLLGADDRLSYPLNYWNALGALTALALPLLLQLATCSRTVLARSLSAAAIPALMLTVYFTLSRGGIAAGAIGLVVFLLLAANRLPQLLTLLIGGAGGGLLVLLAHQRRALTDGLATPLAHSQGDQMLWIVIAVCAVVGLLQAAIAFSGRRFERPDWTRPPKQAAGIAFGVALLAILVLALAANAPSRASNAWSEFKNGGGPGEGAGRLNSIAGEDRYKFWTAAVDENATAPLIGTGSGTFQFWWARNGTGYETVRDAHSLYLQTLGEVGIVGLLILVAFFVLVLVAGVLGLVHGDADERTRLAAVLAALSVFLITAAFDWMWQVPVLPVTALLLASGLVVARSSSFEKPRLLLPLRLGVAAVSLLAIVVVAIPLASYTLVRQSQAEAREGDVSAALDSARSAQNVQPYAASPRLQEALLLEIQGDYAGAEAAARAATERESTNWRNWLVLSRVAAEHGRAKLAVSAYEEARSLNPHAAIFER